MSTVMGNTMNNAFLVALHLLAGTAASVLSYPMRAGTGLEKFLERYEAEKLFVLQSRARELLVKASACVSCGRCESRSVDAAARGVGFPVNAADFLTASRAIHEVDLLTDRVKGMRSFDLRKMEDECPVKVPFTSIVELIDELTRRESTEP
jgi:hypothetical protein